MLSKGVSAAAVAFLLILVTFSAVFTGASEALLRTYDFKDNTNRAYKGTDPTTPPLELEIGSEFSPEEYVDIANLDGKVAEYSSHAFSDYHRFRFKILEPITEISQIYVEHQGYGTIPWRQSCDEYGGCEPGLTLFVWDYSTSSWKFLDSHREGEYNGVAKATINEIVAHYVNADGYLNLLAQTQKAVGSCPFLFAYNGEEYVFVADMYNRGIIAVPNFPSQPEDYAKIDSLQLQQNDSLYSLQIAQEYDEISYLDRLSLITVDHSPDVDVFPSLLKSENGKIYTVSKHLAPLVTARDQDGKDVMPLISRKDGLYYHGAKDQLKTLDLNLGNLSGTEHVKLVLSGYTVWDNEKMENLARFVDVKDRDGRWRTALENFDLITPSALPRAYVINLTGKFLTNDYSVRIGFYPDERIDYLAVDTSPDKEVATGTLPLVYANLHFRGYSNLQGSPGMPDYFDSRPDAPEAYSKPTGNFTRFGDVRPLLANIDDEFVIMHHGDEISVDFQYFPAPPGVERDFMMYSWGYYKGKQYLTGGTVEPLPFHGMSTYPYPGNENYPLDDEHVAYLRQYNTREYESEADNDEANTHNTIYTDYVKLDVWKGGGPTTTMSSATLVATTSAVGPATTIYSTITVTTMAIVHTPVIPLPYLAMFGFLAIVSGLYVIRKIRKA
jgi:hypothetical protein